MNFVNLSSIKLSVELISVVLMSLKYLSEACSKRDAELRDLRRDFRSILCFECCYVSQVKARKNYHVTKLTLKRGYK